MGFRTAWARASGPALAVALILLFELVRDTPLHVTNPPAFFNLIIVLAGFVGGLLPALASAVISWAYIAYFFSGPELFHYTENDLRRVVVWGVTMPLIAWMVGVLNRRAAKALASAELAALERVRWAERARSREELRRSEAYLAEAQRLAHAGSWAWSVATREFVHLSQEHYRLHGLDPGAGTPTWESVQRQIHPEDRPRSLAEFERAVRDRTDCNLEYRCVLPDGTIRTIQSLSHPVFGADGQLVEFVGTEIDITERKRMIEALRESEARFRVFVDHAADAFFLYDTEAGGTILDVNRQACEGLGYSREELIGQSSAAIDVGFSPEEVEKVRVRVGAGETVAYESLHRRKDGTDFPVELHIRPFQYGGRRLAVALSRDITDRKKAEKALNESLGLLRAVTEGTPDPIFAKDLQGRNLMINTAGAGFLGRSVEEVVGKDDGELLPPETARAVRERDLRILATGEPETFEETVTAAGGTRTYLTNKSPYRDRQGNVIGLVGIARDITEVKRLEAELRHALKMEALGRLAGGVAHDFNNLLTVITGCSELVFNRLRPDDPSRGLLAEIQKAGERAVSLTRQLLAFSRKQVLQPRVINLNPLLVDLGSMLQRLIGENVEMRQVLAPDLRMVKVDPDQFEQAIINLVVNARDAMNGVGRLIIETRNERLDETHGSRFPNLRPGDYVIVAVSDTGHGMEEATLARIFEPFFTTKEAGRGTGLGLSMVYGFVNQSGGNIEVGSQPGQGSVFTLYLPRTEESGPSPVPDQEGGIPKGVETILLVEDEEAVRTLTRLVLQSYGYTVLEARDGLDGLGIAQQSPVGIHLVLTDLVMPRMGGRELADRLIQARPSQRILFMSGYTEDASLLRGEAQAVEAFIHKPFSPLALARKVRQVLDAGAPNP